MPPEATAEDTFAAAFAQISAADKAAPNPQGGPETGVPLKKEEEPPAETKAEGTETGIVDTTKGEGEGETKTPEEEAAAAAAAKAAEEAAAKAEEEAAKAAAISEREADLLTRFAEKLIQPKGEDKPAPQPRQEPDFNPQELEFLNAYQKEFPDVARAEALLRRAEYKAVVQYVFQSVAAEMQKRLAPIEGTLGTIAQRTHLGDLQQTVPDYAKQREGVIAWAAKQPAYLQPGLKYVIEQGTVDEVKDLVERWKRDTGQPAQVTPPKTEAELPSATKKAVAALAPVSSKRQRSRRASDPNDFDGAFASFANSV